LPRASQFLPVEGGFVWIQTCLLSPVFSDSSEY